MATGSTARAACQVARQLGAARVVMAVPVGSADSVRDLPEADAVVCVSAPERFGGVGAFYRDFSPTTDEQVIVLLDAAQRQVHSAAAGAASVDYTDVDVEIPAGS